VVSTTTNTTDKLLFKEVKKNCAATKKRNKKIEHNQCSISFSYNIGFTHIIIVIIVTVTKNYSVYIKYYYYSKQGEKIAVLVLKVRILMSNWLGEKSSVLKNIFKG
jgi:hypothetical protein